MNYGFTRKRSAEWRRRYYAKGLTYRPGKDGKWRWYPRIRPPKSERKFPRKESDFFALFLPTKNCLGQQERG